MNHAEMDVRWLGQVEYTKALGLQQELTEKRRLNEYGNVLLLLEHPPTITMGRGAKPEHLLASPAKLAQMGISVHEADRGGDITYHGPGQLVAYPILDLSDYRRDLHWYLRQLEEAIIQTLLELGVAASRMPPHTGVWVEVRKIAAIGVKVSRWITTHGIALNVAPNVSHFDLIVPCGIREFGVTSILDEIGHAPQVVEVGAAFGRILPQVLRSGAGQATTGPDAMEKTKKNPEKAIDVAENPC